MAVSNITPELRSAKEKFLYFHDLTACNRICGARFFYAFNSSRASGSNPLFQSFRLHSGVLFRGVFASVLSLCISDRRLFSSSPGLWHGFCARFNSVMTMIPVPLRLPSGVSLRTLFQHSIDPINIATRRAGL